MRVVQTSPPAVEPVLLADAKAFLRVDIDDDDALITGLIPAARRYVETRLKQSLITQSWVQYLDSFPSAGGYYNRAIREVWPSLGGLPSGLGFYPGMIPNSTGVIDIVAPPLQSIDSVQYFDFANVLQTFPTASYNVSLGTPARIQPAYAHVWPISRPTIDSVQIHFTCGYGNSGANVPENVLLAIKMLVTHWYEHRSAVDENGYAEVPIAIDALLSASDHGSYA